MQFTWFSWYFHCPCTSSPCTGTVCQFATIYRREEVAPAGSSCGINSVVCARMFSRQKITYCVVLSAILVAVKRCWSSFVVTFFHVSLTLAQLVLFSLTIYLHRIGARNSPKQAKNEMIHIQKKLSFQLVPLNLSWGLSVLLWDHDIELKTMSLTTKFAT